MNFKSLLVVGLSIATLGLSLPAHAGDNTGTSNDTTQDAIITGSGNSTRQSNDTTVRNRAKGGATESDTANVNKTRQSADVQGDHNSTSQDNTTNIQNSRRTPRK
jgi:hypothetical protein